MNTIARRFTYLSGLFTLPLLTSNCSSLPDAATYAVTGATGAYLGHEITDGESEGALLGAAAGVATGAVVNAVQKRGAQNAYKTGYDKGRSDEVKRLYWVQKNLHRPDEFGLGISGAAGGLTPSFYEIPVPEHVSPDGTIIEAHTQVIEVLEP